MTMKYATRRLHSLDVFRGITIAVMIVVNSPGNHFAYSELEHSVWNGCTLADMVFPFFIIIAGVSSVLALHNVKHKGASNKQLFSAIARRSLYLFFLGLALNIFPNHFDLSHLRILGVLQRIAICYCFSSVLYLTTSVKSQVFIIGALLGGYWWLMGAYSPIYLLSINHNPVGSLDRWLLTPQHLYTATFDPEGLLSTFPAVASALLGNVLGHVLVSARTQRQQLHWMISAGFLIAATGFFWSAYLPINKSLWSSSYVLWTGGLSFLAFALCFSLIEMKRTTFWCQPFILLGKNSMLVYMLHIIFLKIQALITLQNAQGALVNLRLYSTDLFFGYLNAYNASLFYAVGYTLLWLQVAHCVSKWRLRRSVKRVPG